jgi:hypothetical protein
VTRKLLPRGPLDFAWQMLIVVAAYYVWRLARGSVDGSTAISIAHAQDLVSAERALHSFIEPDVQSWAISAGWPSDAASWIYGHAHFYGTIAALLLVYFAHNRSFAFVRNMVLAAMAVSLLGYLLYPTAPPRFVEGLGFTTDPSVTGNEAIRFSSDPLFNPYAAVPSMHVGLALIFGLSLAALARQTVTKVLFVAYPLLITFVVVATGNHFWLDAAAGALVAAFAFGIAELLGRLRPERWSFRAEPTDPPVVAPPEPEVAGEVAPS